MLVFEIPVSIATRSEKLHPDKEKMRLFILEMRAKGMSYRKIADVLGIHWTRVGQILRLKF
jgi:hypothetical protein